jgi:hypothetical protein
MSSFLVIMNSMLDGLHLMTRTKMIGWTAFAVFLLGYGVFAAIIILNRTGQLTMQETLLFGSPAAIAGEIGLWAAAGCLGWSLFKRRKALFDRVFRKGARTV